MVKLELSKKIEDEHLGYFQHKVNPKLEKLKELQCTKLPEWHKNFLDYCICHSEKIAIRKPKDLKQEIEVINSKFSDFQGHLNVKITYKIEKPKKNQKEYKTLSYSELLQNAFSYSSFTAEKTLFDYLLLKAKVLYKDKKGKEIVKYQQALNTFLEKAVHLYFPEYTDAIKIPENADVKQVKEIIQNFHLVVTKQNELFTEDMPWSAYKLTLKNNITVCPYCNRQYITPVFTSNGKVRGEFDHFFPKSQYPYLSMSLYNLIPSCSVCNSSLKGKKEFSAQDIHPFEENYHDFFDFYINPMDHTKPRIEIHTHGKKEKETENYLKMFQIEALYNYHSNQGIEMFQKSVMYTDSYVEELLKNYPEMFQSEEELKALIYGYILEEKDIGKEAFGKLKRDVAKQLGLIP